MSYSSEYRDNRDSPHMRRRISPRNRFDGSRSDTNDCFMRPLSPMIHERQAARYRSRSPLNARPQLHVNRGDESFRFNPPENDILAIFGLSKRVVKEDLYDLYKHFDCRECKIITDKHVMDSTNN